MVYILTAGYNYEGSGVLGVYDNKKLAETGMAEIKLEQGKHGFDFYEIEPHNIIK